MKQIQKYYRTYKQFVLSGAAFLVAVLAIFVGIIPLVQKTIALYDEQKQLSERNELLSEKARTLENFDAESLRGQLVALLAAVPNDRQLPSLFATIDGLAQSSGVSVSDIQITRPGSLATPSATVLAPAERKIGSSLVPFVVSVSGSFEQIRSFLASSIRVRRFVRIRDLTITFEGSGSTKASFNMDAFYAPLPSTIGGIEKPLATFTDEDEAVLSRIATYPLLGEVPQFASGSASIKVDLFSP